MHENYVAMMEKVDWYAEVEKANCFKMKAKESTTKRPWTDELTKTGKKATNYLMKRSQERGRQASLGGWASNPEHVAKNVSIYIASIDGVDSSDRTT